MQLVHRALVAVLVTAACLCFARGDARAQQSVVEVDTSHTVFYEAPTRTKMFVYTPSADLTANPWSWLSVSGGWEADVVSGASVATKAGPAYQATHVADVVSTASVKDFRNMARGEVSLKGDTTSLTGGYAYSTEHDYRSHSMHVNARTDALQHNTTFELSYAHNFDSVCDRVQSPAEPNPTRFVALEDSTGCFASNAPLRTTHPIAIDTYEASWAQSWTPVFESQFTFSGQLVDGFQSDPYRSVILGENLQAQEHEPNDRAREAVTVRFAYYLRSVRAAIRVMLREYWDTWGIASGTGEVELEKSLWDSVRVMGRARLYRQGGAVFWSDDYTGGASPLGPKGQYWSGDRELSPFWSWLVGGRIVWQPVAPVNGRIAGFLRTFKLAGSFSLSDYSYDEYTLGGTPITGAYSYIVTGSLLAGF